MDFFTPAVAIAILSTMDILIMAFGLLGWWLFIRERKSHAALTSTVIELVRELHITLEQVAMRLR